MIALNLFAQEASATLNSLNIRDQLQGAQNQAFGQVAIAPTTPMELWSLHKLQDLAPLV